MTGIDWLAKQSFVYAKRVGVFGWSYGGFMTLRLLSATVMVASGKALAARALQVSSARTPVAIDRAIKLMIYGLLKKK